MSAVDQSAPWLLVVELADDTTADSLTAVLRRVIDAAGEGLGIANVVAVCSSTADAVLEALAAPMPPITHVVEAPGSAISPDCYTRKHHACSGDGGIDAEGALIPCDCECHA